MVVVQRRHFKDTNLVIEGNVARQRITIAQAFAGPLGEGPKPGQRVVKL